MGDTDSEATTVATVATTESVRLRLSPTITVATDWATGPTATLPTAMAAMAITTARGRLGPSPRLRLSPTCTAATTAMDSATTVSATVLATAGDTTGDKLL